MNHDDPDAIEAMLGFLYTGDYSTKSVTMQSHLKIYELADRLDISALKRLSENKFEVLAMNKWEDATFLPCVKTAYDITPPGPGGERLRSMVINIASQHLKELFNLDIGFKNMMIEVPEFGGDLAEVLAGGTSNVTYGCDRCGGKFEWVFIHEPLYCEDCGGAGPGKHAYSFNLFNLTEFSASFCLRSR